MRHLLTVADLSPAEVEHLCLHARVLKRRRVSAPHPAALTGRTVALLFEKPSLRTRVSFEVAARELGAGSLHLSPQEVGLGSREAVADVARVLSAYVHAVVLRTFDHTVIEEFARHATIPVINGLTDTHHPCQGLTDVFTIGEHTDWRPHVTVAYVGDGNNCAHSLMQAAVKLGMHVRIATPPGDAPDATLVASSQHEALLTGGSVTLFHDPREAVVGADAIYTDVWTSMGKETYAAVRQSRFMPYQVNDDLIARANPDAIVLHPLPAHRNEEISDGALDGPHSVVFAQAENRLHVQKAILWMLLAAPAEDLAQQMSVAAHAH
jgi:ornithine carbamoyltransferase